MTLTELRQAVTGYLASQPARFPGDGEWLAEDACWIWDDDSTALLIAILVLDWTAEAVAAAHAEADRHYWDTPEVTEAVCLLITADIADTVAEDLLPEVYGKERWLWTVNASDYSITEWE